MIYAIIVYACMRETPWICTHERIGSISSTKTLTEVCAGTAPYIVFGWQHRHDDLIVTGWDCVKKEL